MLSVHGHKLKVVATDGMELRDPVMADSVIVTTGERYDFELEATNVVDNYWIEAKTLEVGYPTSFAIVVELLYVRRNRRLIRDGEKGVRGYRGGGEEGDYIPIATLSPPE